MIKLTRKKFRRLVEDAIARLPERFRERLNNVAVVVEDEPTRQQLVRNGIPENETLLGLYEGVPQTERWEYNLALPDKISIFQRPIEEQCSTESQVEQEVYDTVWHEIAHHFGMDEESVQAAEQRRLKN